MSGENQKESKLSLGQALVPFWGIFHFARQIRTKIPAETEEGIPERTIYDPNAGWRTTFSTVLELIALGVALETVINSENLMLAVGIYAIMRGLIAAGEVALDRI